MVKNTFFNLYYNILADTKSNHYFWVSAPEIVRPNYYQQHRRMFCDNCHVICQMRYYKPYKPFLRKWATVLANSCLFQCTICRKQMAYENYA